MVFGIKWVVAYITCKGMQIKEGFIYLEFEAKKTRVEVAQMYISSDWYW